MDSSGTVYRQQCALWLEKARLTSELTCHTRLEPDERMRVSDTTYLAHAVRDVP